jgi:hypothetical protein
MAQERKSMGEDEAVTHNFGGEADTPRSPNDDFLISFEHVDPRFARQPIRQGTHAEYKLRLDLLHAQALRMAGKFKVKRARWNIKDGDGIGIDTDWLFANAHVYDETDGIHHDYDMRWYVFDGDQIFKRLVGWPAILDWWRDKVLDNQVAVKVAATLRAFVDWMTEHGIPVIIITYPLRPIIGKVPVTLWHVSMERYALNHELRSKDRHGHPVFDAVEQKNNLTRFAKYADQKDAKLVITDSFIEAVAHAVSNGHNFVMAPSGSGKSFGVASLPLQDRHVF